MFRGFDARDGRKGRGGRLSWVGLKLGRYGARSSITKANGIKSLYCNLSIGFSARRRRRR